MCVGPFANIVNAAEVIKKIYIYNRECSTGDINGKCTRRAKDTWECYV